MATKRVKLSNSYEFLLPESIEDNYDGGVSSFWLPGQQLLLQLSSYSRIQGEQIDAATRLRDRIEKTPNPQQWTPATFRIAENAGLDQAMAEIIDERGVLWIHAYFVWPHVTVYATISGPSEVVRNPNNWAFAGLQTMRPVLH